MTDVTMCPPLGTREKTLSRQSGLAVPWIFWSTAAEGVARLRSLQAADRDGFVLRTPRRAFHPDKICSQDPRHQVSVRDNTRGMFHDAFREDH